MSLEHGTSALRLLSQLARTGVSLMPCADGFVLRTNGRTTPANTGDVQTLEARGLVEVRGGIRMISVSGAALLRRRRAEVDPFQAQHQARVRETLLDDSGSRDVVIRNRQESPLAWLRSRRGKDGKPMVDACEFEAGERLRADFTRGQMMPRVTASWSPISARRDAARGAGVAAQMTETALAARQRVDKALRAVGPELSGVLLDVCCFLKRMEEVEHHHGWPARSGKVMLRAALAALARHYGISQVARGQEGNSRIVQWGTDGYRPTID